MYLYHSGGTRIADTESLSSLSTEECFAASGTVQHNITHNNVVITLKIRRHSLWWVDDYFTTTQALKDKNVKYTKYRRNIDNKWFNY